MFPDDTLVEFNNSTNYNADPNIKRSLKFNYNKEAFEVIDGRVLENVDIPAIKQWCELFIKTSLDSTPIYQNYKFGTSLENIIGQKDINNGFFQSELTREIEEGFALNPAIKAVRNVLYKKINDQLQITILLELQNNYTESVILYV